MTKHVDVVTRFAPSPTGNLHIGGARTALFCWAFARRMGGHFLLRLEDTDRARSSEASAEAILRDLAWMGIDWDEGPTLEFEGRTIGGDPRGVAPFEQSARLDIYNAEIERLLESGKAYYDFTSSEQLDAMRKEAQAKKENFRFHPADGEIPSLGEQRARAAREPGVVRLRAPEQSVTVVDEVLGEVSFGAGEVDDLVIRKADGYPTYHFAVVVDDEKMGVTHVLRGQEHLMNTPKHVMLQRVLGYRTPAYAHMPLIFNDKGGKMSKRERDQTARAAVKEAGMGTSPIPQVIPDGEFAAWLGDKARQLEHTQLEALADEMRLTLPEVSVSDFRRAGYLPGVVANFIALLGWTPSKNDDGSDREKFDMDFLARDFDIARIGKSNSRFDRAKLASFNADALGAMSDEAFAASWRAWCERYEPETAARLSAGDMAMLAGAVKPRVKTFAEARGVIGFVFLDDEAIEFDEKAVEKVLRKGEPSGLELLGDFRATLEGLERFEPEAIEASVKGYCEAKGIGMGKIAQPIRVAITGTTVSPPLGVTLAAVGKRGTLARIKRCVESV